MKKLHKKQKNGHYGQPAPVAAPAATMRVYFEQAKTDMIDGLIAGRLMGDPERRQGKGETTFVVARVRAQTNEGEHLMVNLITFDDAPCAALLALRDGDSLAAAGHLNPKVWTDKQGNTKPALDLVAHRVTSVAP